MASRMASLVVVWSAAARASHRSPPAAQRESGSAIHALATTDTSRADADALGGRFVRRQSGDTGRRLARPARDRRAMESTPNPEATPKGGLELMFF